MTETKLLHHVTSLARAWGQPLCRVRYKAAAGDFMVDEQLTYDPVGEGEHSYLQIRKSNLNTEEVAKKIAQLAGVKPRDVGYAGIKDRNAVTTQWFSVYLPGRQEPDWSGLHSESLEVLQYLRHRQKLRRGAIKANHFVITLREVQGDPQAIEQRLQLIAQQGTPSYFGEQRFGRNEANIQNACDMLAGKLKVKQRHLRSVYLSAARSLLFNQVLSSRVEQGIWNQAISGDAMMLQGSKSFFVIDEVDEIIRQRVNEFDIHPSGPLWGCGELPVRAEAQALEMKVLGDESAICDGLAKAGLKQQRRALRMQVHELQYQWLDENTLQLRFALDSGCYATCVLRECFDY
jgi:tRNA pseudouridine13 synthase